jgi:transcriptional antiterminator NusG
LTADAEGSVAWYQALHTFLKTGVDAEGGAMSDHIMRAYGCLFCTTGKELVFADCLQKACPEVKAIAARQGKYKSVKGHKSRIDTVIMPGYVFFSAPMDTNPFTCFPRDNLIKILTVDKGTWQLSGDDERFAKWLFKYDGLLNFSKAYREGERIRIVSGPLKDMEGQIKRIDKRGRSGQVILRFGGISTKVWLGFDIIEPQDLGRLEEID